MIAEALLSRGALKGSTSINETRASSFGSVQTADTYGRSSEGFNRAWPLREKEANQNEPERPLGKGPRSPKTG